MKNMKDHNPLAESFREVQECFGLNRSVESVREKDVRAAHVPDTRIPRMRTVHEAAEELRRMDANTAVTEYHIRQLAINNIIPRVKAGKKYLINLDAAKLKTMTGNDTLNARFLHENSFDFKPQFKLYINTNYLPVVTDMTIFKSGRIITIPFERHFDEDEQDRTLKAEFARPENRSAILNWLIEGFCMQQEEGLSLPDEVRKATESYEADSDKIKCFATDCLDKIDGAEERTSDVYRAFQNWCRDNGYHPEGMRAFKQLLLSFAQVVRKRPKSGGTTTTVLCGYRLISDFLNPDA